MDYKLLASIVEKVAPNVADMIVGPAGGLAVSALEGIFGVKSDQLSSTIASDPDAEAKLQQLETENYGYVVSDRESARSTEVDLAKLGKRNWVMDCIGIITVIGFFVTLILVAVEKFDASDHDILYMLIGQLTAGFLMVLSFYFGGTNK